MTTSKWFKDSLEEIKNTFEFRLETIIFDITEKISRRLKKKKVTRTQFAEMLNVSPPAVTKILNGNSNFTLKTLLSIADALELNLKIDFEEKSLVTIERPCEYANVSLTIVSEDLENIIFEPKVGPEKAYSASRYNFSNATGSTAFLATETITEIAA